MKTIRCTQCDLVLGEAAEDASIVCSMCVVLRYEMKTHLGMKPEIPFEHMSFYYTAEKQNRTNNDFEFWARCELFMMDGENEHS